MKQHIDFSHIVVFVFMTLMVLAIIIVFAYQFGYTSAINSQKNIPCKSSKDDSASLCTKASF